MAQRAGDYARVGELLHAIIPELEAKAGQAGGRAGGRAGPKMLSEVVTEEQVGEVISRATGIPLGALLEGEGDRLLHMEEALKEGVVGQDAAVKAVANCVR
jgi:ATP-dependent Clp protease ATP-binding subunit ClpB